MRSQKLLRAGADLAEKGFRVKTVNGLAFELTYQEFSDDWHIQPIIGGYNAENW